MTQTTVDFVAKGPDHDMWRLVLVENGPWQDPGVQLGNLQNRLYDCVDALIDGTLIEQFPNIWTKTAMIQVDAYNTDTIRIQEFFTSFSTNIFEIEDYKVALEASDFVDNITFSLNLEEF